MGKFNFPWDDTVPWEINTPMGNLNSHGNLKFPMEFRQSPMGFRQSPMGKK